MSAQVRNPFAFIKRPEHYHEYRPHFHSIFLKSIKDFLGDYPVSEFSILDVACGTGRSTNALKELSKNVTGIDSSPAMIHFAQQNYPDLTFQQGQAEKLPFPDKSLNLINISMGLHWVDHHSFLKEVARVLKEDGLFIIDNYGFEGVVSEKILTQNQHFEFFNEFLPAAEKNKSYTEKGLLHVNGLKFKKSMEYKNTFDMDKDFFINFVQTTSNFLILADDKKNSVIDQMEELYSSIFDGSTLSLNFGGQIKIYQLSA